MALDYQNYRGFGALSGVPFLLTRLALVLAATLLATAPLHAQPATPPSPGAPATERGITGQWIVTIPQAFPLHVFNWIIAPDGTYQEDGRNALNGRRTLVAGRWTLEGVHAVMRQSNEDFVFDGTISGGCFIGRLFHNGKNISSFTARKSGTTVRNCDGDVTI